MDGPIDYAIEFEDRDGEQSEYDLALADARSAIQRLVNSLRADIGQGPAVVTDFVIMAAHSRWDEEFDRDVSRIAVFDSGCAPHALEGLVAQGARLVEELIEEVTSVY